MPERLQKILASAGVASRRAAEEIILAGRVQVNGQVAARLGSLADPQSDTILVDGKPIQFSGPRLYVALHKPVGVVTTVRDPQGRATVLDVMRRQPKFEQVARRIYPAGRLDADSSGLVLLTNDGDLAYRLTHPKHHIEKEYVVEVGGRLSEETISRLEAGIILDGRLTAPLHASILARGRDSTRLRLVLREGRKRQIRRMMTSVGHPVRRLERVRIGTVRLGDLPPGGCRRLTTLEIDELMSLAESKLRGHDADSH